MPVQLLEAGLSPDPCSGGQDSGRSRWVMLECLTVELGLCWALAELHVELQPLPGGSNKWLQGQPEAAAVCSVDRQSKGKGGVIFFKVGCWCGCGGGTSVGGTSR